MLFSTTKGKVKRRARLERTHQTVREREEPNDTRRKADERKGAMNGLALRKTAGYRCPAPRITASRPQVRAEEAKKNEAKDETVQTPTQPPPLCVPFFVFLPSVRT